VRFGLVGRDHAFTVNRAMRLLRLWLAVAGLSAGVLWGYAHPGPVPALALCALGSATSGFRRRVTLLLVGVVVAAFGAGALDASLRTARTAAVSVLASDFAHCEIKGRVLEDQGALGTLVALAQAHCDTYAPIQNPGTVMFPNRVATLERRCRLPARSFHCKTIPST
jgi:hypothetical protein